MLRMVLVLVLAVVANGCSNSVDPQSIEGTWAEDFTVPGSGQDMTLSLSSSNVSGSGHWCGEAIGCATTTVAGTINDNRVHLVTTFSNGRVQTFDGHLASTNSLTGTAIEAVPGEPPQMPHAQGFRRGIDVITTM